MTEDELKFRTALAAAKDKRGVVAALRDFVADWPHAQIIVWDAFNEHNLNELLNWASNGPHHVYLPIREAATFYHALVDVAVLPPFETPVVKMVTAAVTVRRDVTITEEYTFLVPVPETALERGEDDQPLTEVIAAMAGVGFAALTTKDVIPVIRDRQHGRPFLYAVENKIATDEEGEFIHI